MFCPNCGQELHGTAKFCFKCGAAQTANVSPERPARGSTTRSQPAPSPSPSPPPHKATGLWKLHTFDWEGICPVCQLVHTSETARCPNDGSPLVVAFDAWKWNPFRFWKWNPFSFPVHSAEMCCSEGCVWSSNAILCNRCDATVITGRFLRFRFPRERAILHQVMNVTAISICLLAAVWGAVITLPQMLGGRGPDGLAELAPFLGLVWGVMYAWKALKYWWPFMFSFDFEQVARALKDKNTTVG